VHRPSRLGSVLAAASLTGILAAGVAAAAVHVGSRGSPAHPATFADAQLAASYNDFQRAVTQDGSAAQVAAAVRRLHNSLLPLIAAAAIDPSSKQQALYILRRETLLLEENQPAGAARVLAAARALVAQITGHLPGTVERGKPAVSTPPVVVLPSPERQSGGDETTKSTRPTPTPSATPTPTPAATPPASKPSPSPAPTPPWPFGGAGFDRSAV
jgi:hypothetical protein